MNVATIVAVSVISALASIKPAPEGEIEAKRYNVAHTPELAAACIARNTDSAAGEFALVHPLYGTERLAVMVRNGPTGDTLATVFVEGAGQDSTVRVVTAPYVEQPEPLTKRLLGKC